MAARGKARMPWSVKGVGGDTRELAKVAASDRNSTMGDWLSDVIRRVGAAEAAGRPLVPASRPSSGVNMSGWQEPATELLDDAALTELISERIERSETRILDVLAVLDEIVGRLADRLDRLEQRVEARSADDDVL
ncbi:MAG: hypothetical protein HQ481_12770 [Alphaproteobacteria bacterium]|nr:hypothetical protein [Alphaproteobacteria bacterium]